jgi:hypothetical protein
MIGTIIDPVMIGSDMVQLKYTVQHDGNNWNYFVINLPTGLTIQQRKMHRSCLEYKVNGGYVYDTNQNIKVKFGTAPDTWPVRSAIKRARNTWLKMHRELFANNSALKPKWHDFKMALLQQQMNGDAITYNVPEDIDDANIHHEDKGITWSVFTSEDSARAPNVSGQTNLTISDKDEFTSHLLGSHIGSNMGTLTQQFTSIGALESWINSRPDLDPVTTISDSESDAIESDPLNMLFNDGEADNEIIENFTNAVDGDGNQEGDVYPMYHLQRPMDTIMERAAAFTTSASPISYFTGFNALLGQVYVKINSKIAGTIDLMFDVDPRGMTI